MELSELRQTPHLSASAVSDYLDCSLLYKLGRVDKIKPAFTPDAMEFGSAIHLVLAEIKSWPRIDDGDDRFHLLPFGANLDGHWLSLVRP